MEQSTVGTNTTVMEIDDPRAGSSWQRRPTKQRVFRGVRGVPASRVPVEVIRQAASQNRLFKIVHCRTTRSDRGTAKEASAAVRGILQVPTAKEEMMHEESEEALTSYRVLDDRSAWDRDSPEPEPNSETTDPSDSRADEQLVANGNVRAGNSAPRNPSSRKSRIDWKSPEVQRILNRYSAGDFKSLQETLHEVEEATGQTCNRSTIQRQLKKRELPEQSPFQCTRMRGMRKPLATRGDYRFFISKSLNTDAVVVCEGDGTARLYRCSKRRATRSYYRCSTCDNLRRKSGTGPLAYLTASNGILEGDMFPAHNERCTPMSMAAVEALDLDRRARLEVSLGLQMPRQAWTKAQQKAIAMRNMSELQDVPALLPSWNSCRSQYRKLQRRSFLGRQHGTPKVFSATNSQPLMMRAKSIRKIEPAELESPTKSLRRPKVMAAAEVESENVPTSERFDGEVDVVTADDDEEMPVLYFEGPPKTGKASEGMNWSLGGLDREVLGIRPNVNAKGKKTAVENIKKEDLLSRRMAERNIEKGKGKQNRTSESDAGENGTDGRVVIREITADTVIFDGYSDKMASIDISNSPCSALAHCNEPDCVGGIKFGNVVPFTSPRLADLHITEIGLLARALAVWRGPACPSEKEEQLLRGDFTDDAHCSPAGVDWHEAVMAVVQQCSQRQAYLSSTEGYHLFDGWASGRAQRNGLVKALEAVRSQIIHSIGMTTRKVAVIGAGTARVMSEVLRDAEWIQVGRRCRDDDRLSFETWEDLDQPWETGMETRVILVMCEINISRALLAKLKIGLRAKPNVTVYVMMPVYSAAFDEEHEMIQSEFPKWREEFEEQRFRLCGFDDGRRKLTLAFVAGDPSWQDDRLIAETLRPEGAKRLAAGLNSAYGLQLQVRTADVDSSLEDSETSDGAGLDGDSTFSRSVVSPATSQIGHRWSAPRGYRRMTSFRSHCRWRRFS